jgi:hypothetical protein
VATTVEWGTGGVDDDAMVWTCGLWPLEEEEEEGTLCCPPRHRQPALVLVTATTSWAGSRHGMDGRIEVVVVVVVVGYCQKRRLVPAGAVPSDPIRPSIGPCRQPPPNVEGLGRMDGWMDWF